jgi:hypothetical protein
MTLLTLPYKENQGSNPLSPTVVTVELSKMIKTKDKQNR